MCAGLFGIQCAWGLQNATLSAVYECLGARTGDIPMLWLAAPITGLIVQPVVGLLSDKTASRFGRRRPYLVLGGLFSAFALICMPHAPSVAAAVGLLWLLDTAVNVAAVPCRAFVGDIECPEQRNLGFAMQSVVISLGAVLASLLPWCVSSISKAGASAQGVVPLAIRWSYYVGAVIFIATILYTAFTTRDTPVCTRVTKSKVPWPRRLAAGIREAIVLPPVVRQLAVVQFFTWLGLFMVWIYFVPAIARTVFHAGPASPEYGRAVEWAGVCFSAYNAVAVAASFGLLWLGRRYRARTIHLVALLVGGVALAAVGYCSSPEMLLFPMVGFGIAWASILSMPYAMMAATVPPARIGYYLGVFNVFIVIPQVFGSLALGHFDRSFFHGSAMPMIVGAGIAMGLGGFAMVFVGEPTENSADEEAPKEADEQAAVAGTEINRMPQI